jgi:hypothetical protein
LGFGAPFHSHSVLQVFIVWGKFGWMWNSDGSTTVGATSFIQSVFLAVYAFAQLPNQSFIPSKTAKSPLL